jgi:hypothetical protein
MNEKNPDSMEQKDRRESSPFANSTVEEDTRELEKSHINIYMREEGTVEYITDNDKQENIEEKSEIE